jgi:hypothetical protein
MSAHTDLMKSLLAKKAGTPANRKATQEAGKALKTLSKAYKQGQNQVVVAPPAKTAARGK